MARNGTDFGIRVGGLGDAWFTAPAKHPVGLFFPGYSQEDANPDIGDSAIMETLGVGGFAMAAAPAIVAFVGGSTAEAFQATNEMYGITWARSRDYTLPVFDFAGVPTGIDVRKVIETGIYPQHQHRNRPQGRRRRADRRRRSPRARRAVSKGLRSPRREDGRVAGAGGHISGLPLVVVPVVNPER